MLQNKKKNKVSLDLLTLVTGTKAIFAFAHVYVFQSTHWTDCVSQATTKQIYIYLPNPSTVSRMQYKLNF